MTIKDRTYHWKRLAGRDWKTTCGLFNIKRYDACLFFCHLTLEKLLKGLVVYYTQKEPPFVHDLERLAMICGISFSDDQINDLKAISAFNIAGRYSDYKFAFYKKCTRSYTLHYFKKTKGLIQCLQKKYPKR